MLTDEQFIWLMKNWCAARHGVSPEDCSIEIVNRKEGKCNFILTYPVQKTVMWEEDIAEAVYLDAIKNGVYKQ